MDKHIKRNFLIILIIVLLVEVFIFNFKSLRLVGKSKEYSGDELTYMDVQGYIYVVIENVNTKVKTVHLELDNADNVTYEFMYTDESVSGMTNTTIKQYMENVESSKYISCYLSRRVKQCWI